MIGVIAVTDTLAIRKPLDLNTIVTGGLGAVTLGALQWSVKTLSAWIKQQKNDSAVVRKAEIQAGTHTEQILWQHVWKLEARVKTLEDDRLKQSMEVSRLQAENANLTRENSEQREYIAQLEIELRRASEAQK